MNSQKKYKIDINKFTNATLIKNSKHGSIYSIQNKDTEKFYAAKVIYSGEGEVQNQKVIDCLIEPLVRLQHLTIVKYYGYSPQDFDRKDNITLIMDLAKNGSLKDFIEKIRSPNKEIFYNNTSRQKILIGIARGMIYLHLHNITSINLTPSKILLDDYYHPLITDYGLFKLYQEINASDEYEFTYDDVIYIAPETISKDLYNEKSDVYSFGIIMYEVITELTPFPKLKNNEITQSQFKNKIITENYRPEFKSPIKPSLQNLIEQCWSPDPDLRPTFETLFNKLAYNSNEHGKEFTDESSNDDKYYLKNVDKEEVISYADEISENDTTSTEKKLKNQKEDQNAVTISQFNALPIKSQQVVLSKIKNDNKSVDDSFLANVNKLLLFLLQFNCDDSSNYVEITNQSKDELITGGDEEPNSILLHSCCTEILHRNEVLDSTEFINILNQFDHKMIDLKYPSKIFTDTYEIVSGIKRKHFTDLKIEVIISGIRQTDEMLTYKTNIDSVIIDYSLTTIGWNAFSGCLSLTHIRIPQSIKIIEKGAFLECSSLTSIYIPESVTEIGDRAFFECTKLSEINIPSSITTIGKATFYMCSSLKSIQIPDSISVLNDGTFIECSSLLSISLPSNLTKIGECCFSKCSSLSSIQIPDTVAIMDKGAFYGCASLVEFTVPPLITEIGDHEFQECISLQKVVLHSSVTAIRDCSFCRCSALDDITIPNSVKTIGKGAFYDCLSLKEMKIPTSITKISMSTFQSCESLTEFSIPDSITEIEGSVFRDCTLLKKISIPSTVTEIGKGAFYNCTSLVEISIPSISSIKLSTFQGCSALTKINIPSSVTVIGDRAFRGCSSLRRLSIPSSVSTIGKNAFYECSSLEKIFVPSSVTSLDQTAFPKWTKVIRD